MQTLKNKLLKAMPIKKTDAKGKPKDEDEAWIYNLGITGEEECGDGECEDAVGWPSMNRRRSK